MLQSEAGAFVKTGVVSAEEMQQLLQRLLIEMNQDDFRGMCHMITVIGTKPLEE